LTGSWWPVDGLGQGKQFEPVCAFNRVLALTGVNHEGGANRTIACLADTNACTNACTNAYSNACTNAYTNAYNNPVKPRRDIIATTSNDRGLGKTMESNSGIKQWNQTVESNSGIKQWNQTVESNSGIKQNITCHTR